MHPTPSQTVTPAALARKLLRFQALRSAAAAGYRPDAAAGAADAEGSDGDDDAAAAEAEAAAAAAAARGGRRPLRGGGGAPWPPGLDAEGALFDGLWELQFWSEEPLPSALLDTEDAWEVGCRRGAGVSVGPRGGAAPGGRRRASFGSCGQPDDRRVFGAACDAFFLKGSGSCGFGARSRCRPRFWTQRTPGRWALMAAFRWDRHPGKTSQRRAPMLRPRPPQQAGSAPPPLLFPLTTPSDCECAGAALPLGVVG